MQAAGTGFIINKDGFILTNNHVVEGADQDRGVALRRGRRTCATRRKVVGRDPLTDSALIQLTEKPDHALPEAKFGDSSADAAGRLGDGDRQPVRPGHTVSVGVISALERPFPVADGRTQDMLQTDAAINPATPAARC